MTPESNQFSNSSKDSVEAFIKHVSNEEKVSGSTTEKKKPKKKITIEVDEDDPCLKDREQIKKEKLPPTPGNDPRFQQQNQTLRCYVMYTDFYRCEHILGEGHDACTWFKRAFQAICPNDWILQWDEIRETGRLPWHKYKKQGNFPGRTYGER